MSIFDRFLFIPEFALFAETNENKTTEEIIGEYGIAAEFEAAKNSQKFTNAEI